MPSVHMLWLQVLFYLITARKRSLRRLCFYTCLSFCPQGVPGQVPLSDQVHPPMTRYTPVPGTPPRTRYTPLGPGTPPWDQVHPLRPGTPSRTRYTPGTVHTGRYGQQAGGTHPTGMHSYHVTIFNYVIIHFEQYLLSSHHSEVQDFIH